MASVFLPMRCGQALFTAVIGGRRRLLPARSRGAPLTVRCPEASTGAARPPVRLGAIAPDRISDAPVIVPMVFPVVGPVSWQDTFLASRGRGRDAGTAARIFWPRR